MVAETDIYHKFFYFCPLFKSYLNVDIHSFNFGCEIIEHYFYEMIALQYLPPISTPASIWGVDSVNSKLDQQTLLQDKFATTYPSGKISARSFKTNTFHANTILASCSATIINYSYIKQLKFSSLPNSVLIPIPSCSPMSFLH